MSLSARIGDRVHVFDPSVPGEERYLNDHTLVQDDGGTWHLFGITAPEPARPLEEVHFLHATAPALRGPWTAHPPVIEADVEAGETHVWAPHVIREGEHFLMFYTGGTPDSARYRIQLATSPDLWEWDRDAAAPLFEDGFDARDPMVRWINDQWVLYYTRTSTPTGGNHQVAARTSSDLISWSEPRVVFESDAVGTFGGPTESPFVFPVPDGHGGSQWVLSVCDAGVYDVTRLYASNDLFHWEGEPFAIVEEHCPEYVVDDRGRGYVTGAGWARGGLHLRPIEIIANA